MRNIHENLFPLRGVSPVHPSRPGPDIPVLPDDRERPGDAAGSGPSLPGPSLQSRGEAVLGDDPRPEPGRHAGPEALSTEERRTEDAPAGHAHERGETPVFGRSLHDATGRVETGPDAADQDGIFGSVQDLPHETRPHTEAGIMETVRAYLARQKEQNAVQEEEQADDRAQTSETVDARNGPDRQQTRLLFDAMDAPLQGLQIEDLCDSGEVDRAFRRRPVIGMRVLTVAVLLLIVLLVVWAGMASLDEVTHAEGSVVGSRRTQSVQNLEGGILRAVLVQEGQLIERNTVVARLDNEAAASSYRDAVNRTMETMLSIARLEAEGSDREPVFPTDVPGWISGILGHAPDAETVERGEQIIRDQLNTWKSRRIQLKSEIEVLKAQYEQRRLETDGQVARRAQLELSLELAKRQRDTALNLVRRNNFSRLEYLEREERVVDLQGQIAQLASGIPKAQAAVDECRQRIASRRAEQYAEITDEISRRRIELTSLKETLSAGGDRVTRTELRSPVRGIVKQIHVSSTGSVVRPGESVMDIVPTDDTLLVEAKVPPGDVAFLHPGQETMVKVSAYDFNIYGGLVGRLESISADTIEDRLGNQYYLVKIRTPRTHIVYHRTDLPIIPGMLVTADILTGKKSVLEYLLSPVLQAKDRALREK